MEKCEYFNRCGKDSYECSHGGKMSEDPFEVCENYYEIYLKEAAQNIDRKISLLEEATNITQDVLKIEFTI